MSFHYCGNDEAEAVAKRGMEVLAEVFRKMFLQGKVDFTPEGIISEARKIDKNADERMIRLGLYVAPDFGILSGWAGGNPQQPDITPTGINERVVKLKKIDTLWDNYIVFPGWCKTHLAALFPGIRCLRPMIRRL